MTAITQKIRRFTGGISDQPDEQKLPGQVRDAVNCIPDVVQGLIKRPGMNLIRELDTDENGKWFFIDKANNFNNFDRYVGRIDNVTGKVKVWDLDSGKEMDVCYTDNIDPLDIDPGIAGGLTYNIPAYETAYTCEGEPGEDPSEDYFTLNNPEPNDLQVLTINDYTFVVNRKVPVQMSRNTDELRGPEGVVELRSIAGLTTYEITFQEPTPNQSTTTAQQLTVTSTGFVNDAPTCSSTATQTFSNQSGGASGTGLEFTLEVASVVAPGPQQPDGTIPQNCVYTTRVTLNEGGDGWAVGDTVTVNLAGVTHVVRVDQVGTTETMRDIGGGTVTATTERENPKADDVLDALVTAINTDIADGVSAERIGNGLYITRSPDTDGNQRPFTMSTPNSILLRVLSSSNFDEDANGNPINFMVQCNDVAEVPLQTKHNLPFFIRNSFSDADDYYVQFKGDNNGDGTGTYVEIARPGLEHSFNTDSMPHGLLRLSETRLDADGDLIVTFLVASFIWASREAGDDNTNPRPSFAPEQGATFGRPINNLSFFRNRFIALTDENVVASVAGDFFNFWGKTALQVAPQDPIDLQVSNNFPSVLYGAVASTAGLVLFSENAQFMLGTENDVLEPRTARTSLLCTYNYNRDSNPINLGTTVGFVSGIGRYTRFYEMANISRDQEPEVVEQTKVVERLVPGNYYDISISKDNQLVSMAKRGMDTVWVFRYFNTGEKRAQSAWTRFKFDGEIVSHALINDSYFVVLHKDDKIFLVRGDIRALRTTQMLTEDGEEYRTFLDYTRPATYENVVEYTRGYSYIDPASIRLPIFNDSIDKLRCITYSPDEDQGWISPVELDDDGRLKIYGKLDEPASGSLDNPQSISFPGQKFFLGYVFPMDIVLPQFFIKKESSGQSDSWNTANLIIRRVKLNFGRIGYFETTLKRLGRPDYTQIYEAKPMDQYDANDLGYMPDYEQTTPVYQRNTSFVMSIHAEHPSPAVLYDATWEGTYTENYVKRL